jgi:hypothetical protein
MGVNVEGPVSVLVTDSVKYMCQNCNGVKFSISTTIDDPADAANEETFDALSLTYASGTSAQGVIALCLQCGAEQVPYWQIFDAGDNTDAATTMTNLVQVTTPNLLAGLYMFPLVGTDIGKYFVIASNTAADPTVITTTVSPNNDSDGIWVIQNWIPVGFTAAS